MDTLELAVPVKGTSLKDLVVDIKEGEQKLFPFKNDQSIRSLISSSVKDEFPDRKYTTKRVLIVVREK